VIGLSGFGLAKNEMEHCSFQLRMKMGWEYNVDLALALEMEKTFCEFNERMSWRCSMDTRIPRDWVPGPR
jgi:hypothetical protein